MMETTLRFSFHRLTLNKSYTNNYTRKCGEFVYK